MELNNNINKKKITARNEKNKATKYYYIIRVTGNALLIHFKYVYPVCVRKRSHFCFLFSFYARLLYILYVRRTYTLIIVVIIYVVMYIFITLLIIVVVRRVITIL